uniref:tetratricopeptide repeat protein n=1 Tax=Pseudomonas viridiflava TaxID=33069 RepID=UPI003C6DDC75
NVISRLYKENARFADFPKRSFVKLYLDKYGFSKNNQQVLNDTAYFWQQANYNVDAIWLLEKIIDNNPERVVAYLNLADAYWSEGEKQAAQKNYNTYVSIMIQQGRQQKIPSRVMERYDPRW